MLHFPETNIVIVYILSVVLTARFTKGPVSYTHLYFDRHGENGFDYAYLYPGMNKVLQAAGRVIRTEEDKGVIALLDDRFAGRRYLEIFPREWRKLTYCNVKTIGEKVEQFWKNAYIEPESDISV